MDNYTVTEKRETRCAMSLKSAKAHINDAKKELSDILKDKPDWPVATLENIWSIHAELLKLEHKLKQ